MAVTYAFTQDAEGRQRVGKQHVVSGTLTATGTYTTSGDAVAASLFGLGSIESFEVNSPFTNGTEALVSRFIPSSGKLMHFWTGGAISSELDEITSSDTITSFVGHVTVRGR